MDNSISDIADVASLSVSRRRFLGRIGGLAAAGGLAAVAACSESDESPLANATPTPSASATPTPAPTIMSVTDTDMMVMMTQLHYLQAEFYSRAVLGAPLAASLVTGSGTQGEVTGPRAVTIADALLADYLREIATEKIDQVVRLRGALGSATPARPALNLSVDPAGSFGMYAANAGRLGVTTTSTGTPALGDVYASQEQLLLGAFLLEDVVMNAWRGVATLMVNSANIDVAAGLLATSAFHSGLVRSQLFIRGGVAGSTLRDATVRLSDLRDSYGGGVDDDRGVSSGSGNSLAADIDPADGDGEIYGRLPSLTINTVYMTRQSGTSGGFFPAGLNGVLRDSTAV